MCPNQYLKWQRLLKLDFLGEAATKAHWISSEASFWLPH